jgi:hypothetical protein
MQHDRRSFGLTTAVVAIAALAGACRGDRPSPEADNAAARAGAGVRDVGHAVVRGAEGLGNGVVCGTRELGQTMSGTQGDPAAEAKSREACERAQQRANEAGRSMDQFTREVDPHARGGGPTR